MYSPIDGAVPLTPSPEVSAMFNWAAQHGITWPKIIYPVRFPPGYIGTMAVEDIYPNERVITAPNSSLMTARVARDSELSLLISENLEDISSTLQVITFLLLEKAKGPQSTWAGFIGYLPEDANNLEDWKESELNELQDPALIFHVSYI